MPSLTADITGRECRYRTEDMEAGLMMHAHTPESDALHDTRCDEGVICLYLWPRERHVLKAGERIEYDGTRWHGIYPVEVPAAWTNTTRAVQPEFHEVLEQRHMAPEWATSSTLPAQSRAPR